MNTFSTFHRKFISTFKRMTDSDVFLDEIIPYVITLLVIGVFIKITISIYQLM